MNHYCTYFDQGFLAQGLALWRSLKQHDHDAVLWMLALDETTVHVLRGLHEEALRIVTLEELEIADPELAAIKSSRTRVEYYFTISPCWPLHLLRSHPEIDALIYLDADLFFFGSAQAIWNEMGQGDVLLCAHCFPDFLSHYERHGRYNVGVLGWKRNAAGLACLNWWRAQCLEWCYDRLEPHRYADQKYLEQWPCRFEHVRECAHPGVNLAPWNWMNYRYTWTAGTPQVDGRPLVVFHFARFRPIQGDWWWQSGQLDYGVMPWRLRQFLYGSYWQALDRARAEIRVVEPTWQPPRRAARLSRDFMRALPLRLLFGSDWLRSGNRFVSARAGLGRYSGRFLASLRRTFLRR